MKRLSIKPRKKWQKLISSQGFLTHKESFDDWNESAYYSFSPEEFDTLKIASIEVNKLAMKTVQHIIDKKRFSELNIKPSLINNIKYSWAKNEKPFISQFNFMYDGLSDPKLLSINSDTYNNILESSILQNSWIYDNFNKEPNLIHSKLLSKFSDLKKSIKDDVLYFTGAWNLNSYMTLNYLKQISKESKIKTEEILINSIEIKDKKLFSKKKELNFIFKAFPMEWLVNQDFYKLLSNSPDAAVVYEPAWTILLESKALLPIMYDLFPNHPNLLPCYFAVNKLSSFAKKPFYSRDGNNITLQYNSLGKTSGGPYASNNFIYQKFNQIQQFNSFYPIIKAIVVDNTFAGMGVRESSNIILDNLSRFIPSIVESK